MTASPAAETGVTSPSAERRVNDFSIQVATVNGTGSQTANNTLIRAILRMGIPVSGKNVFPSNIQGLPTWFNIRVCEQGWLAPTRRTEVVVAMNLATAHKDVADAPPGACIVCDKSHGLEGLRDDVSFFPVPFSKLGIEMASVEAALTKAFGRKPKALEINLDAARAGAAYAQEHFAGAHVPFRVERRDLTAGKILIDGNSAGALGAAMAGCTVLTWYPITPSSSLAESLIEYLETYRKDADGNGTFAHLQAEDELAAIGMVIGASWAGARAMTSTSGPGISLMSEFIGLGYYAEIPAVIANVQRVGPSTGLPTRTAQGDLTLCAYNSHGDTKHPLLLPASPQECYELMMDAFDLAETFQTPVFFVTDLDLGMNNWLCDAFPYPEKPIARGKVLDAEEIRRLGVENWGRYKDVDGDGVPYRTLPGTEVDGAAYFTRGSGHDERAVYTEDNEVYRRNVDRLARKFDTLRTAVPAPVHSHASSPTPVGLIAFGTTHWAVIEAREKLRAEHGVEFDYLRLRAFPFADEVAAFVEAHERVYVVEQNRDAQMASMLRLEHPPSVGAKLRSILNYDGLPITAGFVTRALAAEEAR
jgi:2-oxoglutarate ferredoxin oxidoreductase subunit alpha